MEEMNEDNVREQGTGETSAASGPTWEAVPENSQGQSVESVVGTSDASPGSKTNNQGPESTVTHERLEPQSPQNVPAASTSAESDQKVKFKVPDLSKVIRKPITSLSKPSPSTSDGSTDLSGDSADLCAKPTNTVQPPSSSTAKQVSPKSSSSKLDSLSPAEKLKPLEIPLVYKEPSWGGPCDEKNYGFEVLKNGTIIENVDLTVKSFHVFGRLPSCDVTLEHPSLSRHHAVVQYCVKANEQYSQGWYLFDLDSTHGTWVNKIKMPPKVYYRLKVGHVIKFGGSSRLFIMQGPEEDTEEESELSVTEIKEQRQKQKLEMELRQKQAEEMKELNRLQEEQEAQDKGCSWGMFDGEIADEAPDSENPFALPDLQNEDLYADDPKKALKNYYEREGLDIPEYNFEEASYGQHKCTIELPIDDSNTGNPIIVEVQVSGKKKEAVVQCALEACRVLDRYGELRKANQESRKKKTKNWEEQDFYDSDEDTYLDRTGEIERKRQQRMKKAGKLQEKAETYESLVEKLTEVQNQVKALEEKISKAKKVETDSQADGLDALDAFMTSIKSGAMDTKTRMKLKLELLDLRKEQQRLEKLVNIARPASLPPVQRLSSKAALPMVGKVRALNKNRVKGPALLPSRPTIAKPDKDDDEEEEEDEAKPKPEVKKIKLFSVQKDPTDKALEASKSGIVGTEYSKDSVKTDTGHVTEESIANKEISLKEDDSTPASKESKSQQELKDDPMEVAETDSKRDSNDGGQPHHEAAEIQPIKASGGRRRKGMPMKSTGEMVKKLKEDAMSEEYSADDPDYSVWVPPTGQSGDGRTSLNEKYGY